MGFFQGGSKREAASHDGDACVLGAAERAGNALYSARVYLELGRRLAHAHAARQSRPDLLSQFIRDRRSAKSLTFTLGPLQASADAPTRSVRQVCLGIAERGSVLDFAQVGEFAAE